MTGGTCTYSTSCYARQAGKTVIEVVYYTAPSQWFARFDMGRSMAQPNCPNPNSTIEQVGRDTIHSDPATRKPDWCNVGSLLGRPLRLFVAPDRVLVLLQDVWIPHGHCKFVLIHFPPLLSFCFISTFIPCLPWMSGCLDGRSRSA